MLFPNNNARYGWSQPGLQMSSNANYWNNQNIWKQYSFSQANQGDYANEMTPSTLDRIEKGTSPKTIYDLDGVDISAGINR